jgi:hypothetical protein
MLTNTELAQIESSQDLLYLWPSFFLHRLSMLTNTELARIESSQDLLYLWPSFFLHRLSMPTNTELAQIESSQDLLYLWPLPPPAPTFNIDQHKVGSIQSQTKVSM